MKLKNIFLAIMAMSAFSSCVSKKKYMQLQGGYDKLEINYNIIKGDFRKCEEDKIDLQAELDGKNKQIGQLQDEIDFLKKNNNSLISQMENLSIVSKAGAESMRKSLEILDQQNKYIKDLNQNAQRKDSINLALVTNLKRSLQDVNDEDVKVEVRGGVVYVSISDKMLFQSGSAVINSSANKVLGKVATVINDHKDLNVLVEGHTDDVPIHNECVADNWDLSVKRATAVVRYLEKNHKIDPERLTAAGRGENDPKVSNDSKAGRKQNRRTEIVLTPRLDQFLELAVPQK